MAKPDLPPILVWDAKDPIGAVHIIHGMAEHPERYGELANALTNARFTVWAHYQRGHCGNPHPGILGHFADQDGWRLLVEDAWAVSNELKTQTGLPLLMFAHSMGSFIGQGVLAEHGPEYQAVILTGTNGPPSLIEQQGRAIAELQLKFLGPQKPGMWLFEIVFGTFNALFGLDAPRNTWLSRDASEVEKYNCDPCCGFPLTSKAWLDLVDGRIAQGSVEFFKRYPPALPIHVMAGTMDPVGELGIGVRRLLDTLASAGLTNVSSKFFKDDRHELVHEIDRGDVIKHVVSWFGANIV